MEEYKCESCIYSPPSSCDGKPCCVCEPDNPLMSAYTRKEGADD